MIAQQTTPITVNPENAVSTPTIIGVETIMIAPQMIPTTVNLGNVASTQTIIGVGTIMIVQTMFQVNSDFPESTNEGPEVEKMILDGNKGWLWTLTELPEIAKGKLVKFNVIEREIGDRLCDDLLTWVDAGVVGGVIAYDIEDADTLLGILFDESLKSKCIAAIDVQQAYGHFASDGVIGLAITIVLVQGAGHHTNIDSNVLDCFSRIMEGR